MRPDFVTVGWLPTLTSAYRSARLDDAALSAELRAPGGFLCRCHGSRFDVAGRVAKNAAAPIDLVIPDYRFSPASLLTIG